MPDREMEAILLNRVAATVAVLFRLLAIGTKPVDPRVFRLTGGANPDTHIVRVTGRPT